MKKIGVLFLVLICIVNITTISNAFSNSWLELPEKFESDELILRETSAQDALVLAESLVGDPNMTKYYLVIPMSFSNRDDVLTFLMCRNIDGEPINKKRFETSVDYTICLKTSGESIGKITLCKLQDLFNVDCFISKKYQGNKYAYQATKSFIDKVFEMNDISKIPALSLFCNSENFASKKTLEKLVFEKGKKGLKTETLKEVDCKTVVKCRKIVTFEKIDSIDKINYIRITKTVNPTDVKNLIEPIKSEMYVEEITGEPILETTEEIVTPLSYILDVTCFSKYESGELIASDDCYPTDILSEDIKKLSQGECFEDKICKYKIMNPNIKK